MDRSYVFTLDGPTTMVHRGWQLHKKEQPKKVTSTVLTDTISSQDTRSPSARQFKFINKSKVLKDKDLRKIKRSHSATVLGRSRINSRNSIYTENETYENGYAEKDPVIIVPKDCMQPSLGEQCSIPIGIQSQRPDQIRYFLEAFSAMYPMEAMFKFNPHNLDGWLSYAYTDNTLIQAMLHVGFVYTGLIRGVEGSEEAVSAQNKTIGLVNKRLMQEETAISDGTLAAVACLALAGALCGEFEKWRIHMAGLRQMVVMRGGMARLSVNMQHKILRSDLTGALHAATEPYFDVSSRRDTSNFNAFPMQRCLKLFQMYSFDESGIDWKMIKLLDDLDCFSRAVNLMLTVESESCNSIAFCDDSNAIQYGLLTFTNGLPTNTIKHHVEEALRMAALIYIKELINEFPQSANGSCNLIRKLKVSLLAIRDCVQLGPWLLWLYFVGGTASKTGSDRAWFRAYLVRISMTLELSTWEQAKEMLEKSLWVETSHAIIYKTLWDEVAITMSVLDRK